ncbi:MAG: tagaturonate reductase [Bacteroidota bacterium]|jgi:tagaturonate reductase|nr:MAG: tagaturonate reductase [Bacteroidota bacterium]
MSTRKPLNRNQAGIATRRVVKVVQFGGGNFLRAFTDWMVDILNERAAFNGDVEIVQSIGRGSASLLNDQEGLYHVVLNGLVNGQPYREVRLITCVRGFVNPGVEPDRFLAMAENPDLTIIFSNTTEAGIAFDPEDSNPETIPNSFPGKLTLLLYRRYLHFGGAADKALTIIPCELIERNGTTLKELVIRYIKLWNLEKGFFTWVDEHTTFCNTLVDRIVPGFPKENINEIWDETGFEDQLVVTAEPYHLFAIEGPPHVQQLLPGQDAGLNIVYTDDLDQYRTRKVRILNGGHTCLTPVGLLLGITTVREAVEDKFAGVFLREAILNEIIPTIESPEEELVEYMDTVLERFRNPYIHHELKSIALNSISKFRVRVLPSLLAYRKRFGTIPDRLAFALACLIQFYRGEWHGRELPVNDESHVLSVFREAWSQGDVTRAASQVLTQPDLWGMNLREVTGLEPLVTTFLRRLQDHSVPDAFFKNHERTFP